MGPELALALMAGGTAAQMIGQRQQQREQQRILNRAMERTEQTQRKSTQQVLDEAQKYSPDARMQAMQAEEAATAARATQDLGGGAAANIPEAAGNVSDDYRQALAASGAREGSRLAEAVARAARVRAPGQMQMQEGMRRADLTGNLNSMWSSTKNLGQASERDAAAVEVPLYAQLGKLAQMAGSVGYGMPTGGPPGVFDMAASLPDELPNETARLLRQARPRISFEG